MNQSRILVVEDNPKNLKLVRDVLTYSGYEVLEATSGEDGVRVAGEQAPDLILMDLQLPGIDGAEALRQIRLLRQEPRRPDRGGHRVRDERRPAARVRLRVQRLRREADQRAQPARSRSRTSSGLGGTS